MLCTLGVGQNAFTYMSSFPLKFLLESFSVFSTMLSVGDVKRLMPQPLPQSSDSPLPSSSGVEQIWTPFHTGHLSQHNLLFSTTHSFLVLFSPPSTFSYLCSLKPTFPEKVMAPDSSTLAWKIPWTEEPGRLQSMGSLKVGHDWATSLPLFTFMHWRRKWQPTPVFLPGESQGRGSLVGCHLWGCTDSDTTEVT